MKDYYASLDRINNMGSYIKNYIGFHSINANWYHHQIRSWMDKYYGLYYYAISDGIFAAFTYMLAVLYAAWLYIRGKKIEFLLLALTGLMPLLFYSFFPVNLHGRNFLSIMVPFYAGAGLVLSEAADNKKYQTAGRVFLIVFISLYFINSAVKAPKIVSARLNLKPIAEYIHANKVDSVIADSVIMYMDIRSHVVRSLPGFVVGLEVKDESYLSPASYLGKKGPAGIELAGPYLTWGDIQRLYDEGRIKYLLTSLSDVDPTFPPPGVLKDFTPLVSVPAPQFVYTPGAFDSKPYAEALMYLNNDSKKTIALYDLSAVFKGGS
jgi:hypothetical protein